MTPEFIIGFARQSIEVALFVSMPMLAAGLVVGVIVSILQAATQIQEQTLSFIPKIVATFVVLLISFPFVMNKMISYTQEVIINIPTYIR